MDGWKSIDQFKGETHTRCWFNLCGLPAGKVKVTSFLRVLKSFLINFEVISKIIFRIIFELF